MSTEWPSSECLSSYTFDRLRAGELSGNAARVVEAHVVQCGACAAKQRALDKQVEHYLAQPQAHTSLGHVVETHAATEKLPGLWLSLATLAAAAALVLLYPRADMTRSGSALPEHATRSKGALNLSFFVKRGEHVFRGSDGERLRPGDFLRFTARPTAPGYLSIFGIDRRGVANLYYPVLDAPHQLAPAAHELQLAAAIELDQVLGDELFVATFCREPQAIEHVRSELENRGKPIERAGCATDVLHVYKERAPP